MSKILLLNGSAHQNGCSATALNEMIKVFEEEGVDTELIRVGIKDIRGCISCNKCSETGKCVFDDLVNEVAPRFEQADSCGFIQSFCIAYVYFSEFPCPDSSSSFCRINLFKFLIYLVVKILKLFYKFLYGHIYQRFELTAHQPCVCLSRADASRLSVSGHWVWQIRFLSTHP